MEMAKYKALQQSVTFVNNLTPKISEYSHDLYLLEYSNIFENLSPEYNHDLTLFEYLNIFNF